VVVVITCSSCVVFRHFESLVEFVVVKTGGMFQLVVGDSEGVV